MAQKTSTETVVGIIIAFTKQRTWSQAELARSLGASTRTVRRVLDELSTGGWQIHRDVDPPHVYWSVDKSWFPGALFLEGADVGALIRLLATSAPSAARAQLFQAISRSCSPVVREALTRVIPPAASEAEEKQLPLLLDALEKQQAIRATYYSASKGRPTERVMSIARVVMGPPTRFIATCHNSGELRWFRLESTSLARLAPNEPFRGADDAEVEALLDRSVDGFHGAETLDVRFFVSDPDARWVAHNLPDGLSALPDDGGIWVEAKTAGLLPIARFVVGLGASARCLTPELQTLVVELSQGALSRASLDAESTEKAAAEAKGPVVGRS